ncbi:MAG: prenyltransferase/squalene oxidase repeat-containing protein, partial [Alphaproteobacteria bacterium]
MSRQKVICTTILVLVLVAMPIIPVAANGTLVDVQTASVDAALAWLRTQQQPDGSFPSTFGHAAGITCDVLFAVVAAGGDPAEWRTADDAPSMVDYLASVAGEYTDSAAHTGKLIAAVVAAGGDPSDFGGMNLIAALDAFYSDGAYGGGATDQVWAIIGLAAARRGIPSEAVDVLKGMQAENGGWGDWGTDTGTTALALQALVAAGEPLDSEAVAKAIAYYQTQQNDDGGFPFTKPSEYGTDSDANSTAYVIQGLIAVGQNPLGPTWSKPGGDPLARLLDFQLNTGAFEWQTGNGENLMATAQAVPAVMGRSFPFLGRGIALRDALEWLFSQLQEDGSFPAGFGSPVSSTAQGVAAIAAAGQYPTTWRSSADNSPLDFLSTQVDTLSNAGQLGRVIMAVASSYRNPYYFGARNLVVELERYYDATTGSYDTDGNIWNHSLAMLALASVGQELPANAIIWLENQQNADGGWGWAVGQDSDTNSTAIAMQALIGAGVSPDSPSITSALAYLRTQQNGDGGFPYVKPSPWGTNSDANSTANVIQGLIAADEDPQGWDWTVALTETTAITMTLHNPMERLLRFQLPDGSFEWQMGFGSDFMATVQSIPAIAKVAWPLDGHGVQAANRALAWLRTQQQDDGSFPSAFGSPAGITIDALFAIVSAGQDPSQWKTEAEGSATIVEYLASVADTYTTSAANTGKLIAAIVAAGRDPRDFGGVDLIAKLDAFYDQGAYGTSVMDQVWALIGLAAARQTIPSEAIDILKGMQAENGGWGDWGTDTNTTALALQALIAGGESPDSVVVLDAIGYYLTQQNDDGGFPFTKPSEYGTDSDANSTAYVIQGLLAIGQDPLSNVWTKSGGNPFDKLLSFQLPNGAFEWQPGNGESLLATVQAVPALLAETNPLRRQPCLVHLPLV